MSDINFTIIDEFELLRKLITLETGQVLDLDLQIAAEQDAKRFLELKEMREQIINSALDGIQDATEEVEL